LMVKKDDDLEIEFIRRGDLEGLKNHKF
jgi:hypothetical protein